ncbi:MAG: hypothetical protein J5I93_04400 [Pirellulaceae bacterium]|nr:hypothetical protein [Pirellulaceae bacterium]
MGRLLLSADRGTLAILILASFLLTLLPAATGGQDWVVPREQHAWARFPAGSWKQVRVTTRAYSEAGEPMSPSVMTTRSVLEEVDEKGFTLRVEVTVSVNGKEFKAEPHMVRQLFGEPPDAASRVGTEPLIVGQDTIDTQVHRWVVEQDGTRTVTNVHLSPGCPPYVLKRHTLATNAAGTVRQFESLVEVTRLSDEIQVLGENRPAWHVRTVQHEKDDQTTIEETHCPGVPDGVVRRWSKRYDRTGRLLEESELELLSYHIAPATDEQLRMGRRTWLPRRRRQP